MTCSWVIPVGDGNRAYIWFDSVSFSACDPDGVHVYAGTAIAEQQELVNACDQLPPQLEVDDKDVLVSFVNDKFWT